MQALLYACQRRGGRGRDRDAVRGTRTAALGRIRRARDCPGRGAAATDRLLPSARNCNPKHRAHTSEISSYNISVYPHKVIGDTIKELLLATRCSDLSLKRVAHVKLGRDQNGKSIYKKEAFIRKSHLSS